MNQGAAFPLKLSVGIYIKHEVFEHEGILWGNEEEIASEDEMRLDVDGWKSDLMMSWVSGFTIGMAIVVGKCLK